MTNRYPFIADHNSPDFIQAVLRLAAVVLVLICLLPSVTCFAQAHGDPSADDVQRLMDEHPLSVESWPLWRDLYLRLYFIDAGEPEEFYNQLYAFMSATAQENHLAAWESDPVVWVIRSGDLRRRGRDSQNFAPAIDAARKAIALGDPEGVASMNLAQILIQYALFSGADNQQLLLEAEDHLARVSQKSPRAKLSAERGYVALLRKDRTNAIQLFKTATDERPRAEWIASRYLTLVLMERLDKIASTEITKPFVERFPESSEIHGWHAFALFLENSFSAAAAELEHARRLGDGADKQMPVAIIREIENNASLGQEATEGLKAFEQKRYDLATTRLRQAWKQDRRSNLVASGLMFSQLHAVNERPAPSRAQEMATEFADISTQFPGDGQLQVGHGIALAFAERYREAQLAFERGRKLGADVETMVGQEALRKIALAAHEESEKQLADDRARFIVLTVLWIIASFLSWVAVMFLVGMILAVCIPRTPDPLLESAARLSVHEIWLERFYLVMLSISLLVFYVSVPFVALGILAVALCLVGMLMIVRILHYGILYRGFWATWHMLRLVFFGSAGQNYGIEIQSEQHPKLFKELESVAERIDTPMVDQVFLVPGAQVAVSQEGAGPFGLFGRRKRVLHLGIAILPWLTTSEFRSILAHEYAHFSHRDPFFGRFIFQVSVSLANSLAVMRAAAGDMNYVNPFYGAYWLYLRAYALLSAGYSRSREYLADRRALTTYGKTSFVSGLTKICQESEVFDFFAYHNIKQLLVQGNALINVFESYRDYREQPEVIQARTSFTEHVRQRTPGWFDSHPTFMERLAAADFFPDVEQSHDTSSALDLLSEFKTLEESLTELLTDHMHQQLAQVQN